METAFFAAAAFALGSIPTGVMVARARGIDLRQVGSGNIGATNVGRALGKRWAIFVLVCDAAKGWLPAFVAQRWLSPLGLALVALAAVLGHMFSVFLKGKGGKGVATSLGAALALTPVAALMCAGVYLLLYLVLRISSVGSLVAIVAYPVALWVAGDRERAHYLFAGAIAVLVIARHRENLRRLARGQELKG